MERAILNAFAARYPASAQRRGGKALRLRNWELILPEAFASASARLSFLDAMERLERSGILRLTWAKRRIGDELTAAELADPGALYDRLGRPRLEDEEAALARSASASADAAQVRGDQRAAVLFRFVSDAAGSLAERLAPKDMEDAAAFFAVDPGESERLPLRALSVRLYRDSKRLEALGTRLKPVIVQAFRVADAGDDSPLLPERAYPEAAVAGDVDLVFADGAVWKLGRRAIDLSLSAAESLSRIRKTGGLRALTVENKETFHAFARVPMDFDFIVCSGGRLNRAVRAVLRALSASGAAVFHAGDLDADGIAILGEVSQLCGARPFGMDTDTFDRYLPYARDLDAVLVARLTGVPDTALSLPGIRELAQRIRDTRRGVEQEIIDYAFCRPR